MNLEICTPEDGKEYQWVYHYKDDPSVLYVTPEFYKSKEDFQNSYERFRFTDVGPLANTAKTNARTYKWVYNAWFKNITRVKIYEEDSVLPPYFATFEEAKSYLIDAFIKRILRSEYDLHENRGLLEEVQGISEQDVKTIP